MAKLLLGDKSDNIEGIYLLGEKTLVKFFPEILEKPISYTDILERAEELLKEQQEQQHQASQDDYLFDNGDIKEELNFND